MTDSLAKFDEEQARLILARAADLQARAGGQLSLPEIEAAAAEAGIDQALVRQAAAELGSQPKALARPRPRTGALGVPMLSVQERAVGKVVDASAWEPITAEIRRQYREDGEVQLRGNELHWISRGAGRDIRVTVTPRDSRTLVRVEEKQGSLAGGLLGGLGGGLAGAGIPLIVPLSIAALNMPGLIAVLLPLWFLGAFMLARYILGGVVRNRDAQLAALADGIAEVCDERGRIL